MDDQQGSVQPLHVLCVLGSGMDLDNVEMAVRAIGGPLFSLDRTESDLEHDPRMPDAFEACMAELTFTDADWDAVHEHDSVAYVLAQGGPGDSEYIAERMLALVAELFERCGATAIKCESSGLAHGRDTWLELAASADAPDAQLQAWVKRPILSEDLLFTCGMHLLGRPDVELQVDDLSDASRRGEWVELIDGLTGYLHIDAPAEIRDGEGFRLAEDAPRWILRQQDCDRYPEDDIFYNPQGYWRLTPS
ncbi:hypothetical protein [Saccharopolyspora oryzae]|uniref:DUF4261 domain-containing protein n=1 Tax=Saccharopolyspora oryzae TaxID=2997343 RepID=A0ABT4VA32_9PSEU|nr:hypothetical protein [Saccharopolyspora oryzae]MDA3630814.1 hypothetical protein [Saccharopolyspora oryzae]